MKFYIKKINEEQVSILRIEGVTELDMYNSIDLLMKLDKFLQKNSKLLIFNLKEIQFMDSSAMGIFVNIQKRLNSRKIQFALTGISQSLMRILKMSSLYRMFYTISSLDEINSIRMLQ